MKLNFVPVHFSTSCLYDYLMSHSARMIFCLNMLIAIFFHSSLLNRTDKIGMLLILNPISGSPSKERAVGVNKRKCVSVCACKCVCCVSNSFNIYWHLGPRFNSKAYVRVSIKEKMKWGGSPPYATGFIISQRISSNNRQQCEATC